jgi:phage terminase large subunit-like protein
MTRFHEDDLAGRILRANDSDDPQHEPQFPRFTPLVFPAWDPRREGSPWLFPERFPPYWYETQRALLSDAMWASMAQQQPRADTESVFATQRVTIADTLPRGPRWHVGWDFANSVHGDYTSAVRVMFWEDRLYVDNVWRRRCGPSERNAAMRAYMAQCPAGTTHWFEIDGIGKEIFQQFAPDRWHRRAFIWPVRTRGLSKYARALQVAPFFDRGVVLKRGDWNATFLSELRNFSPSAAHDDQVDALWTACAGRTGHASPWLRRPL